MRRAFFSDFYLNACYTIARKSKGVWRPFFVIEKQQNMQNIRKIKVFIA